MAKKRLFIIDTMALAFRNYHAFGARPLTTSNGLPTSAIFGSALFLLRLIEAEKPDYLLAATDSKESTFRHKLYPQYKANRGEMPEDLALQIPYLFRLFELLGVQMLKQPGVEADDLIGSVVTQFKDVDMEKYIVSGDKDFMQLVDAATFLYAPKKAGEVRIIDNEGVMDKFGCSPHQVIDVLALIGDASDNVPGVKGIGEKGAAKLISTYGSLDAVYDNIDELTNKRQKTGLIENKDMAYLSQELVTIKTDIPLESSLEDYLYDSSKALTNPQLLEFFQELEFKGLSDRAKSLADAAADGSNKSTLSQEKSSSEKNEKKVKKESVKIESKKPEVAGTQNIFASIDVARMKEENKVDYRLANSRKKFEKLKECLAACDLFSFDSETTGLNIKSDKPIGLSFSTASGIAWYLPLISKHLDDLSVDEILKEIQSFFIDTKKIKVAHNLKFDLQMLRNIGINIAGPIGDTMIAAFIIDAFSRFGIDYCSEKYLNFKKLSTEALIGKKAEISMVDVPLDLLAYYACEDADCCFRLNEEFEPLLNEGDLRRVYQEIDMPLVPILALMELNGVFVDASELAKISDFLAEKAKILEEKIYEISGEVFNISSTKQLQEIIFTKLKIHEKLGIKRIKKTKSGYSTDVSVLEKLSEHPLPKLILDYRTVTKLKNTYVDTLPQLIEPSSNRIHTSFHQTGAQTGRLSSSKPNLQNIPIRSEMGKEVRRAFRAENSSCCIVSADYSQIELRLLAHMSGDENLKNAFAMGGDIHKSTAATMFKKSANEVNETDRSRAKAINYGLIYGMGPQRLARTTGVSLKEAKQFIESYFESFPQIRKYIDSSIAAAKKLGFSTTLLGRRRPIEGLDDSGGLTAVNAQNIAVNSPIQGTAADLIKLAMIKIQNRLDESSMEAKMLLQVHDELVFECPKSEVDALKDLVRDCMEHAMQLDVSLTVEIGQGNNWLEAH